MLARLDDSGALDDTAAEPVVDGPQGLSVAAQPVSLSKERRAGLIEVARPRGQEDVQVGGDEYLRSILGVVVDRHEPNEDIVAAVLAESGEGAQVRGSLHAGRTARRCSNAERTL